MNNTNRETIMVKKQSKIWDAAEYLDSDEVIAEYLSACLEEGDIELLRAALNDVARAKGMTELAKETGVTRDGLYKALSPSGNPSFVTVQKILAAFGLRFSVVPVGDTPSATVCPQPA